MPAIDSIVGVEELKKGKKTYLLIQTNEVDEYERVPSKAKRKRAVTKKRDNRTG